MYANADNIDPREYTVDYEKRELIDKWILSKLNKLIKEVTDAYNSYDLTVVVRKITDFLNNDLSNWYIRINRRRFWESELTENKKAVYLTTYEVLLALTKLVAPITPFISEEIYKCLTEKESVHLESFPKYNADLINDAIEEKMDLVRDICSLGRFARDDAKIKVRQPISEVIIDSNNKDIIGDIDTIIKEELNVKNILYISDMTKYMDYVIKPNFREVGKKIGSKVKAFQESLTTLTNEQITTLKEKSIVINVAGEDLEVTPDMVEINVKVKEGYYSSSNAKTFVILNTDLTQELILEGIARELVRKIQSLRKDADLVITDRIKVYYDGDTLIDDTIKTYSEFIKNETLAVELIKKSNVSEKFDMNDTTAELKIEKI